MGHDGGRPAATRLAQAKAYSYLRFSTPEQMKGDSLRRQTELARRYAEQHGLDLDETLTFRDLGVSASRGKNAETGRLAYFLEAVETGVVEPGSFLLVESLDRISRRAARKAIRVLEDIVDAGITVVTLNDNRAYSADALDNDPVDLLVAVLTFMRAHEESETKARRLKAAWEQKRRTAAEKPLTARAPAWLRLDRTRTEAVWEVVEERAAVVRRIFDMTVKGHGQGTIAMTLNREGVPTFGRAKMWHRSYVKKILANEAVIGEMTPHTVTHDSRGKKVRKPEPTLPNYYPAVVQPETFARVQAMRIGGRRQPSPKGQKVTYLVAGLAKCGWCGATMTRVMKGPRGGRHKLVCTRAKAGAGCEYHAVDLQAVESVVVENANFLAGTAPTGDDSLDAQWESLENAIGATEEQIGNVLDAIAAGNNSPALAERLRTLEEARDALMAEREEVAAKIGSASSPLIQRRISDFVELVEAGADKAAVNAAMRQLFRKITVDREGGTLEFEWAHGGESTLVFAWPREPAQGRTPAG
jgi:DNA invertase Pin-like site-specific DNA recombinase